MAVRAERDMGPTGAPSSAAAHHVTPTRSVSEGHSRRAAVGHPLRSGPRTNGKRQRGALAAGGCWSSASIRPSYQPEASVLMLRSFFSSRVGSL